MQFFRVCPWESLCAFRGACGHVVVRGEDFMIYSSLAVQHGHPVRPASPSFILFLLPPLACLIRSASAPRQLAPLFFALYLLLTHRRVAAPPPLRPMCVCVLMRHYLLPHFQRSSTLLPYLKRSRAHLLITVASPNRGKSPLSDWRPHAGLIFRSLIITSDSSGEDSH